MTDLPATVRTLVDRRRRPRPVDRLAPGPRGEDVLVVDKTGVGAGASGIACGVIRNNYFQPAMSELMAACVEVWESDPEALHYHGSGYIALGPPAQESDLIEVHERQQRIGYPSELYVGEEAVATHMRSLYGDWRAPGLTVCLHEQRRRLRVQPGVDARPGRQGPGRRRAGSRPGIDGHRLRARQRRRGHHRPHRAPATSRPSRSSSPSARGSPRSGRCSACRIGSTSASPTATAAPTCRCGPTGTSRRARSSSTRRGSSPTTGSPRPCSTSTPTRRCATTTGD